WLKAIRDDERRSLQIQWSEDVTMLKRRTPSIVGFVERLGKLNDAAERGRELVAALLDGRFDAWQSAARLYATHGDAAVRKWRGILEKDIEAMGEEANKLAAVPKRFPDPGKVGTGGRDGIGARRGQGQGVPRDRPHLLRHRAISGRPAGQTEEFIGNGFLASADCRPWPNRCK